MLQELIEDFNKSDLPTHCEILETALDGFDGDNVDDFIDYYTETYIHSAEIIYYHNAMDYLKEHDPSLCESLGIASELGCEVQDLNSETLASMLLQQNLSEELQEFYDDLEEYFESLADE